MKSILGVLAILILTNAQASEIDDISTYYISLKDAETPLNEKVREAFAKAVRETKSCDLSAAAKIVAGELVSFRYYSGAFERFAGSSPLIERAKPPMAVSVYGETSFASSIVGRFYGLDASINLRGHRVGTDKLGHFMDHGYKLYELSIEGRSDRELIQHAIEEEEGAFGWITTGVKSHADVAANFDGYRFWKDVFGRGSNPYFACENGKPKTIREFTFAEYVTDAWSEAINCNTYFDDEFTRIVSLNVRRFEREGRRYSCPIVPARCSELREHYRQWLPSESVQLLVGINCRES